MHYDVDIHVRYSETDQMGVVYHSNYFPWFEEARTGFFEAIGMAYRELEEQGLYFPLTECGCKFKSPAKYADWVTVRARLEEFKGVQVVMGYQVFRKTDGRLLAEGRTAHVFVDREFRPVNLLRARPDIYKAVQELVPGAEEPRDD
jgi:acyl-CoA thioester hydrolase